jgi:hypothetical protein
MRQRLHHTAPLGAEIREPFAGIEVPYTNLDEAQAWTSIDPFIGELIEDALALTFGSPNQRGDAKLSDSLLPGDYKESRSLIRRQLWIVLAKLLND